MTQNELNHIFNEIKNKSVSFADKYICNVLMNNPKPMQKLNEMMSESFYPTYPDHIYKLDKEFIDDYLRTDIDDHPELNSDMYYKSFETLTPKEQFIVCNMYFDYCLVSIHVELEQRNVTYGGVDE